MLAETKSIWKLFAIKVLKKEFIIENDMVESTKSKKCVLLIANKKRHLFLLELHVCFQTETCVYFVIEYLSRKLPLAVDHWLLILVPLQILTDQAVSLSSLFVSQVQHRKIVPLLCSFKFLA
ncbi:Protein kinase C [Penicillium camemberti]|uniref:non-specific serine/threonine protein kinase n=1 Tax=Penicillium camemberti (strain FM 013) TaxID=1429867 RepID=A0A0G4PSP1_PENC3|nr:Protein kinase C [Penicillium camemberti]